MATGTALPTGTLTFLFTDIESSTRLLHELGEAYDDALTEHRRVLRATFARYNGQELNTEGDAFFVAFPRASDAVAAALAFQIELGAHEWPHEPIKVRAGLHTGDARIVDDDLVGMAIHEAARIASAAHGGQVLVSAATAALAADDVPEGATFADVGRYQLKDIAGATQLLEIAHPSLPAFGRARLASVRPNNLPRPATSLVARDEHVAELTRVAAGMSTLTITGTAGVGKTRLAVALGDALLPERADGVWFLDLTAAPDETVIWDELAAAVSAESGDDGSKAATLRALATANAAVILDNCEHVADVAAEVVLALRTACPSLLVVATSREPLEVAGETVWAVPALDAESATRLFVERAQQVNPLFELDDSNAAAVGRIVRRLDGLPLAIELAAVRTRLLSPTEIDERLEDRFRLLTGGARENARQQTLRAAIDWSYDHLGDDEQLLFRRMSVFAGSFSLNALSGVCDFDHSLKQDPVDVVDALVAKSMLTVEYVGERTRYRLLESLREYGRGELALAGEAATLATQHLTWFTDWAEAMEERLASGPESPGLIEVVQRNIDNIRSALAWATETDRHAGLRLAVALAPYWRERAYREGHDVIGALLDAEPAPTELRMRALLALGALARCQGALAEEVARLEEAFSIDAVSPRWRGVLARALAEAVFPTDPTRAVDLLVTAAALLVQQPAGRAMALHDLATIEFSSGDGDAADAHLAEAVELATSSGDELVLCKVLGTAALVDNYTGHPARAAERVRRMTDIAERIHHLDTLVLAHITAAQIDAFNGKLREAADHDRSVVSLFDAAAVTPDMRNTVRLELAGMLIALGNYDEARDVLVQELATLGPEEPSRVVAATSYLGLVELHAGSFDLAVERFRDAAAMTGRAGLEGLDDPTIDLVAALCAQGDLVAARSTLDGLLARDPTQQSLAIVSLLLAEGRTDEARRCFLDWVDANAPATPLAMASPLEMAGHVLARMHDTDAGAELLGATQAAHEAMDLAEGAPARLRRERSTELLIERLGQAGFDAAVKRGAAMPIDEAFAYALAELRTIAN